VFRGLTAMGTGCSAYRADLAAFDSFGNCSVSTLRVWTPTMFVLASSSVVDRTMTELLASEIA
jgi:hypothetical protein